MFSRLATKFEIFIRYAEAGQLLEVFFVSAVSSLLIIRAVLDITGYPQLGGGGFHIAHMLWGGLAMLLALLSVLVFVNKEAKQIAAVVGGVGFGAFIDELGKFITSNNNYFYQPTIAFIYVLFVLLFFTIRSLERFLPITPKGYAVNALEFSKEAFIDDLDARERDRVLDFLDKSGMQTPLAAALRQVLLAYQPPVAGGVGFWQRTKQVVRGIYGWAVQKAWFNQSIVMFAIAYSLGTMAWSVWDIFHSATYASWGQMLFSMVSAWLAIISANLLIRKHKRQEAYEMLKRAVMVSLFLTQFFLYINQQLSATVGLCINLVIFFVLQYLIEQEKSLPIPEGDTL